jgi:hypothetical protein
MRIRFVQFGGILECKKEKDEELKGLKDRTGDTILRNVGTLLDSHDLPDLKIKTSDGKVFQAHKLILAGSFCIFSSVIILIIIDFVQFSIVLQLGVPYSWRCSKTTWWRQGKASSLKT